MERTMPSLSVAVTRSASTILGSDRKPFPRMKPSIRYVPGWTISCSTVPSFFPSRPLTRAPTLTSYCPMVALRHEWSVVRTVERAARVAWSAAQNTEMVVQLAQTHRVVPDRDDSARLHLDVVARTEMIFAMALLLATSSRVKGTYVPLTRDE